MDGTDGGPDGVRADVERSRVGEDVVGLSQAAAALTQVEADGDVDCSRRVFVVFYFPGLSESGSRGAPLPVVRRSPQAPPTWPAGGHPVQMSEHLTVPYLADVLA